MHASTIHFSGVAVIIVSKPSSNHFDTSNGLENDMFADTDEGLRMRCLLISASRQDLHIDQRTNTVVACHWET